MGNDDVLAWTCTLGLWRANMCWIPVGARNPAEENHYVLDAFDCEVLFFQKYFAPVVAELRSRLPKIRLWTCIDDELPDFPGARSLASWVRDQPATRPNVPVDMDDVVMLSATGGTTGMPKGVMNTHRSAQTFCAHFMIGCPYQGNDKPVNLAAAPMTHTAGLLSVPCTARGGTVPDILFRERSAGIPLTALAIPGSSMRSWGHPLAPARFTLPLSPLSLPRYKPLAENHLMIGTRGTKRAAHWSVVALSARLRYYITHGRTTAQSLPQGNLQHRFDRLRR